MCHSNCYIPIPQRFWNKSSLSNVILSDNKFLKKIEIISASILHYQCFQQLALYSIDHT